MHSNSNRSWIWFLLTFPGIACSGETPAPGGGSGPEGKEGHLLSTSWQWVSFSDSLGDFQTVDPVGYGVAFSEDGAVSIQADCNSASGEYSVDGEALSVSVILSTMALCPPESRSDQFLALLSRADSYSADGETLRVVLTGGGELVFSATDPIRSQPDAAPAGSFTEGEGGAVAGTGLLGVWEWVSFLGMDDSTVEVEDPSLYTLEIRPDGVLVQADCNRGMSGIEHMEGSSITFSPIATTRMACPPGSLGDQYVSHLGYVRGWIMEDGFLYLSLWADGGIMRFRPGGESS